MARRLNSYVHVDGVAYGPDDDVPAEVASRIGAHAWTDDSDQGDGGEPAEVGFDDPSAQQSPTPTGAGDGTGEAPPRTGRGSGIEAWRTFAEQNGVGTDSDMTRDDIIAACEAAGVVDREE
ncbi:hypothetical protein SUDANB1_05253 [Streptomyces sp. enrichment culture]|uniref:hypothetical protein n=1 Tax=Streptomyces sp. enrichment culture TaxID=1795815 RepID=UPI003F56D2B3